jgi:hypothetical protein
MMQAGVALEGVSIVLRGHFNPAVFSPRWFKDQELIGQNDFDSAETEVISREMTEFSMDWLSFKADYDSIEFATGSPEEFGRARDAAVGVLRILIGTPVAALGINRYFHVSVETMDMANAIGDVITPKEPWTRALGKTTMRSVVMWNDRGDEYGGHVQIHVEPSVRIEQAVFIGHNDHYTLQPHDPQDEWDRYTTIDITTDKAKLASNILAQSWENALERAEKAKNAVIGFANA